MRERRRPRVLVTRARTQAGELSGLLSLHGFEPIHIPVIQIVPPLSWEAADAAIRELQNFDLLIFTSANAVKMFSERLAALRPEVDRSRVRTAAVGEKTGRCVVESGFAKPLVPAEPKAAEELAEKLRADTELSGRRVLFPRAEEGRDAVPEALKAAGARVDLVTVYRTRPSSEGAEILRGLMRSGPVDWITFGSGSAVDAFFSLIGEGETARWIREHAVKLAVVGRVTRAALEKHGMEATVAAAEPSMEAMVLAMAQSERGAA